MRYFSVCLLFLLTALVSYAQSTEFNVSIQFIDLHDKSPLPFTSLTLESSDEVALADSEGKIELSLPDSLTTISALVSYGCCLNSHAEITVRSDTSIIIMLESHGEWMDNVEIHSDQNHHEHANITIASATLIKQADQSFAQLASHIPGISMLSHGGHIAKPMIHGLYGHRLQMINHGIIHRDQDWGIEHAPDVSPWAGNHIEIYTRSAAVRYGTAAMGGAYVISTDLPTDQDHWHGNIIKSMYLNGLGLGVHGQIAGSITKNITLTYSGGIQGQSDHRSPDYVLTNTGMRQHVQRINLHSKWKIWQHETHVGFFSRNTGILRSAHIGNLTDFNDALSREIPFYTEDKPKYTIDNPKQNTQHFTVGSNSQLNLSPKTHLHIAAGYQQNERQEFDIRRWNRDSIPVVDLKLRTTHGEISLDHRNSTNYTKVGLRYSHEENRPQDGTGRRPLVPFANTNTIAMYVESEYGAESITVFGGLRYEYVQRQVKYFTRQREYIESSESPSLYAGSLGLAWKSYRLDLSTTRRLPNLYERYADGIHPAAAVIVRGDSTIQSEQVWQVNLSLPFDMSNGWELYTGIYYNYFPNYIYTASSTIPELSISGAFFVQEYLQNRAQLGGLDFSILKSFELLNIEASLTSSLLLGQNIDSKDALPDIPPLDINPGLTWTPSLRNNNSLSLSVDYQYLARAWFYPRNQVAVIPPDAAHLVNVSAELFIRTKKYLSFKVIAECKNITNHRYRTYLNRWRYFANEPGIQPTIKFLSFF